MPQIPEFRDEPFEFEYMVGVQLEKEVSALRSKQETGKFDGEDIRALEDKLAYVKRLDEFGKNRMADSRNTMRAYPRVERFEEGVDYKDLSPSEIDCAFYLARHQVLESKGGRIKFTEHGLREYRKLRDEK